MIKSCSNCRSCCPKDGFPCYLWEMLSCEGMSNESIARDCTMYDPIDFNEPEEDDRYYSPHEVYSMRELI